MQLAIARWDGLAWLCATATSAASISSPVSQPSNAPGPSDFTSMQTQADTLARRVSVSNWSDSSARSLLGALAAVDGEFTAKATATPLLGQRAKRLVLALDRLANALGQNRGIPLKIDPELNQLFEDVKTLDSFDAPGFAAHSEPSAKPWKKTVRNARRPKERRFSNRRRFQAPACKRTLPTLSRRRLENRRSLRSYKQNARELSR